MRLRKRRDDHAWSQEHLSHYVEGDMSWRSRRRLELHAEECPDCSLGIRALRALLRLVGGSSERPEGRAMVFTWLYRIAVNESSRALERRQRRRANMSVDEQAIEVPAPSSDAPASQAERRELREALRVAISQLSVPCRTALVLRDIEGLSTP